MRASSAHPRARLCLSAASASDVAHRTLDVPVRLESLAVLALLSLLHVVRHGERPRERKWSRRTAAAGSGFWRPRTDFGIGATNRGAESELPSVGLGARAGAPAARTPARRRASSRLASTRHSRARLAEPHPPVDRQTRASRASRPPPFRTSAPRRVRPRATRARRGSRASRARRAPREDYAWRRPSARGCAPARFPDEGSVRQEGRVLRASRGSRGNHRRTDRVFLVAGRGRTTSARATDRAVPPAERSEWRTGHSVAGILPHYAEAVARYASTGTVGEDESRGSLCACTSNGRRRRDARGWFFAVRAKTRAGGFRENRVLGGTEISWTPGGGDPSTSARCATRWMARSTRERARIKSLKIKRLATRTSTRWFAATQRTEPRGSRGGRGAVLIVVAVRGAG